MKTPLPCVGFELQYSPLKRDCAENLAHTLLPQSNEFTFDVIQEVQPEQEILILFSNKHSPTQRLLAKVNVCNKLAEGHFRITLTIAANNVVALDNAELISMPISKGISAPIEMTFHCPACNSKTTFHFIANQDGDWEHGILPIYNCGSCGTTRAMIGLISCND